MCSKINIQQGCAEVARKCIVPFFWFILFYFNLFFFLFLFFSSFSLIDVYTVNRSGPLFWVLRMQRGLSCVPHDRWIDRH